MHGKRRGSFSFENHEENQTECPNLLPLPLLLLLSSTTMKIHLKRQPLQFLNHRYWRASIFRLSAFTRIALGLLLMLVPLSQTECPDLLPLPLLLLMITLEKSYLQLGTLQLRRMGKVLLVLRHSSKYYVL
jgi:hypothetical protein